LNVCFRFAGLPFDDAVSSMRTFAEKVLPALRGDGTPPAPTTGSSEYEPSPWDFVAEQVRAYEASGGREGGDNEGVPIVVLTTFGRKTGKLRKSPLMRVTDGTRYAVIGSKGGDPMHPGWYLNLLADPEVTLQDGDDVGRYRGHVAEGDERADWWARAVGVWPDFDDYTAHTDRELPLVVLEPVV
jgi:deazaflavin-dependent oxidoreductase (nitroreductase family)